MTKETNIKPALLVIDLQNFSLNYIPEAHRKTALSRINEYIDKFRNRNCPVIRIYHYSKHWDPGQWNAEHEFPDSVRVTPDDPKIVKSYPDAFNKTELHQLLQELGCNTLFICGLSAVGCALATWLGAFNYDYKAFLIKDALMSQKEEYTAHAEMMFDAVGPDVIDLVLENAG